MSKAKNVKSVYSVMVAGVCAYRSVRLSAASRAAKRLLKQDGVWVLRSPGLLSASPRKFQGAKWFGGVNGDVAVEIEQQEV